MSDALLSDIISPLWWGFLFVFCTYFKPISGGVASKLRKTNNGPVHSMVLSWRTIIIVMMIGARERKNNHILFLSIVMMVLSFNTFICRSFVRSCLSIYLLKKDKTDYQPYENWHMRTFPLSLLVVFIVKFCCCYHCWFCIISWRFNTSSVK